MSECCFLIVAGVNVVTVRVSSTLLGDDKQSVSPNRGAKAGQRANNKRILVVVIAHAQRLSFITAS